MLVLTILMFAFRGIYFATVDESNIPINVTGIEWDLYLLLDSFQMLSIIHWLEAGWINMEIWLINMFFHFL